MSLASLVSDCAAKKRDKLGQFGNNKNYVRRGDLKRQMDRAQSTPELASSKKQKTDGRDGENQLSSTTEGGLSNVAEKEVIKRLRRRGEPIRLFGESDEERLLRLLNLERMDRDGVEGQRNEFMKKLSDMDRDLDLEALKKQGEGETTKRDELVQRINSLDKTPVTVELFRKEPDRIYSVLHDYIMRLLLEWEIDLNDMNENQKRSFEGKTELATMKQSMEYMQAFFKLLNNKSMPNDVLFYITTICEHMQARDYIKASDQYYLLSIGNSAWPIGVTMVGIHERSGREKLFSNKVAHVLNDETTRKWIQTLKRIMTYCQAKYLPDDLAKTAGWVKKS
eukprot:Lithocolla_globosa_v1_NODE_6133_length_1131_cov_7.313835.p1 type:complete len:337 gc:universal NODE_6133_length_1131_cov_7.313835:67-1077(+)